ncbi:MAG: PilW family protein [Pseudomonadota bacterium]
MVVRFASSAPRRALGQRGVSLVELLVSSAIGIFLTGGALLVYIESRDAIQVSASIARLLENGRFAFTLMEPDLRAANYWGLHDFPAVIEGRATDTAPLGVAIAGDCNANFSLDVETPLAGANAARPGDWDCMTDDQHRAGSDIIIVRHVSEESVATADLEAGQLYVRSDESPRGALFVGAEPAGFSPFAENHAMVSNVYYVRPWSFAADDGLPSLRRKILREVGGAMILDDEEVIPGVEDLQIQFGVDMNDDQAADAYVDSDNNAILDAPGTDVVSLRVWLLMRAENPEMGYSDTRSFTLGDVVRTAGSEEFPGNFRRVLLSRTIAVRNP